MQQPSSLEPPIPARSVGVWIPAQAKGLGAFLRVLGPGYLVAVGYMDPGNWATDLAAGSSYGYQLLWVVGLSSLMAMVLQSLSCRLGIASGLDLAQACAQELPQPLRVPLWLLAELAIVACDLAELVGSAIALHLLVGLPLPWGVALTALDTLLLLLLQRWGIRRLEAVVIALVALVAACFAVELMLLQPPWGEVAKGFIPQASTLSDSRKLFLAAGILGATVMPHNLYLHSSLVKSRQWENTAQARSSGLRFSNIDTVVALVLAFLVNAAILVLAGGALLSMDRGPGWVHLGARIWGVYSRLARHMAGAFIFVEAAAFRQIGGFSDRFFAGEELDLSRRLKILARRQGRRIQIIASPRLRTSARKARLYTPRCEVAERQ